MIEPTRRIPLLGCCYAGLASQCCTGEQNREIQDEVPFCGDPVPRELSFSSPYTAAARRDAAAEDPLYARISDSEAEAILEIWSLLPQAEARQLEAEPADIRSDLMLCRFLREHHTAQKAARAVSAHLAYRRRQRENIERVRSIMPLDLENYDASLFPQFSRLNALFHSLQLPGRCGSNDGMPVSLMVVRFYKLDVFGAFNEQDLIEWSVAMMEMRSLCLHNQSLREGRMAKVLEARDCHGFSWSQFFASPAAIQKMIALIGVAQHYPEFLGSFLIFNLDPNFRSMFLLRRLIPPAWRHKLIFADQGDWRKFVCVSRGLSPLALPTWAQYLEEHQGPGTAHRQLLSGDRPQAVRALRVSVGETLAWRVCREDGGSSWWPATLRVRLWHFGDAPGDPAAASAAPAASGAASREPRAAGGGQRRPAPTEALWREELLPGGQPKQACGGTLEATADGTALLEVELQGGRQVAVAAALARARAGEDPLLEQREQSVVTPNARDKGPVALGPQLPVLAWVLAAALLACVYYCWQHVDYLV